MIIEVKVPEVGESITQGVLVEWFKQDGEVVAPDEPLFELETDKVTMQIQAEQGGRLSIAVEPGSDVTIGQVVAKIDTDAAGAAAAAPSDGAPSDEASADAAPQGSAQQPLSPAVRRAVEEHGVDPSRVSGTGKDGRLTKKDVLDHVAAQAAAPSAPKPAPAAAPAPKPAAPKPVAPKPAPAPRAPGERTTRTKMSSLRKRLAERLVGVHQEAAILSTFNEADMSAVMALRARFKERFEKRHGVRLGFMSFFIKAVVEALRSVPALNAQIDGDEIVQNHFYDIGVAVGTERGLVVPVLRDADQLSFAEIEQGIADFAARARSKQLTLDELTGGCFTISNGGVYGSLLSTPILNPPQSGILGLHAIKQRAVVVDDEIVARPMMYLALSYDHRIVDGQQAVTWLRRVVECIESPERIFLEV